MKNLIKFRKLDKYLGVVLCAFFSLLCLIKPKSENSRYDKILIVSLFETAAATYIYSSLKYLYGINPKIKIYCLCLKSSRDYWELLEIIPKDNIYTIKDDGFLRFVFSGLAIIFKLRKKKFDLVIDYELFTRISAILSFLTGSREMAGFYKYNLEGLYRGSFYDHRCNFNQNAHIARNFLALTKMIFKEKNLCGLKQKIDQEDIVMPIFGGSEEKKQERYRLLQKDLGVSKNEKIVCLSPDTEYLRVRNYGRKNYAEVIFKLFKKFPDYKFVLTGTKESYRYCDKIKKIVGDSRCINYCGKTKSIRDLLYLFARSELLITNDNGPGHFAVLTDTKTLVLCSTDHPVMYGPIGNAVALYSFFHCSPCICAYNHKQSRCRKNSCLRVISPEEVVDCATKMIKGHFLPKTINNKNLYFF